MARSYRPLGLARLAAVYALVAALLAFARPTAGSISTGLVILALGQAARLWAAGHLVKNELLVTSGPYRYVRNPLYLGRLLIFSGLCVMATLPRGANWLVLLAGHAVFFGYYLPRKERVEPARLGAIHGATFERYRRDVPSLLPWRGPWDGAAPGRWSAARALRNREHWMIAGLVAVVGYLLWRAGN